MASAPLIFHIPHASLAIPSEARQGLAVTDAELAIELLHMTDRYTDEIFKHAALQGDAIVEFPVSRLVLDPERFVEDDKEAMAARGMGVVYLRRHDGSALRADLTQKAALVRDYYEPHHRRLEECVFQHLRTFGRAIIIDCHSFPVFCSNRHRLPLLARAMSRYVPRSALFYQGNRNERADYLDLAR